MTPKELNKIYYKEKAEYLASIQNDNGSYTCLGCGSEFYKISIHHIIKRSQSKFYYADKRNFIELCDSCHILAEGTVNMQKKLDCFAEIEATKEALLNEYNNLEPYEKSLLFKY